MYRNIKCTLFTALSLFSISLLQAEVRVVPVESTPEPNVVNLVLVYPKKNEMKTHPIPYQFRLDGYSIDTDTEYFPRANELRYDPNSQSIRMLLDGEMCVDMNEALIDALDNNAQYLTQRITGNIKCPLSEGEHIIQAFPVRSYDESLKGAESYVVSTFFVKNTNMRFNFNSKEPYLVYNEPIGTFYYREGRPILLDFLVKNCELSSDGYKIRFSIDGKVERLITLWIPYYIYDLPIGTHNIRLELLDPFDKVVSNAFTDVTKTIVVKKLDRK